MKFAAPSSLTDCLLACIYECLNVYSYVIIFYLPVKKETKFKFQVLLSKWHGKISTPATRLTENELLSFDNLLFL